MELTLTRSNGTDAQVHIACDGQPSHTFDLRTLVPGNVAGSRSRSTTRVMTVVPDHRAEWHAEMTASLQYAQQQGADWQIEVDFYTAILTILDGQTPALPEDHPYAPALADIQAGIAAAFVKLTGDG
jgi:hypothetical protein